MGIQANIQRQVRSGYLDNAIQAGIRYCEAHQLDAQTEWDALQSRWKELSRNKRLGLLSFSEENQERNRITLSILEMAEELERLTAGTSSGPTVTSPAEPIKKRDEEDEEMRILFLASNPSDTGRLNLQDEFVRISQQLQTSRFRLLSEWAVTTNDLQRVMLMHRPHMIHFSGHGTGPGAEAKQSGTRALHTRDSSAQLGGIYLQDKTGKSRYVDGKALAGLFGIIIEEVPLQVVILNACYSEPQAQAINQHVPYVIGMSNAIQDRSAIQFSSSFYMALSQTNKVDFAFRLACNQISLDGGPDEHIPILHAR